MTRELTMEKGSARAGVAARERLLERIPARERRLDLAGIPTAVLEGGEGSPLVLLHGPGEHGLKWMQVFPGLAAGHRVVAPDLPGHGASAAGEGPLTAERVSAWLAALIERTCPSPPTLVGQTVGGAIAARFAADHGERIRNLVLVDTLGLVPFQPAPEFGSALAAFVADPGEATFESLWRQCSFDFDRLRQRLGVRWDALAAYTLDRVLTPETRAAQGALMELYGFPAIDPDVLARIRVPTTLVWGRHDLATDLAVAEEASRRYGWPLQVIEGAADDPATDQPERFVEVVRRAARGGQDPAIGG